MVNSSEQFQQEVEQRTRFEFGSNWLHFLSVLDEARIQEAERSLVDKLKLGQAGLAGRSFLDIGSGSGLFSLAARRLGARVHSFDYDPQSVACTQELKRRYYPGDKDWQIEQGSVLDQDYLRSLGLFDYVYSWGVLHHTGQMWQALANAQINVADDGHLYIAIYNDQGWKSRFWRRVKQIYNRLPGMLRRPFVVLVMAPFEVRLFLRYARRLKPQEYIRIWRTYKTRRGMNRWHDMVDWVGGYPYEVARPEAIIQFYQRAGFTLVNGTVTTSLGCNEFVFQRHR